MATVRRLLEPGVSRLRQAGLATPQLDAELLLAAATGTDRTGLLAHPEAAVGSGPEEAFAAFLERRLAGEPVAYIRGVKEFHGILLGVDRRALVPRPETELLVELALARITGRLSGAPRPVGSPPLRVWDVGTGSGAIAVALAVALRRRGYGAAVAIVASDVSAEAVELALENAVAHGVADAIRFEVRDLVMGGRAADLVVANLPYLARDEWAALPPELSYEPREALDGGPDGLDLIRRLLAELPGVLHPGGRALLEIGAEQGPAVAQDVVGMGAQPGSWRATIHPDLAGRARVAEVEPS